ncbi:uncharacterized protein LOC125795238 [Astyanax mexicanus]|uniref:uncharacterized protein LOC125795238 n=1 Tax=Astyanax mexicanus TaxID=7994 RepID=UPI0020CB0EEC|nr:uncharacterized protein LOC125795238 [Astyanax mexicanus]
MESEIFLTSGPAGTRNPDAVVGGVTRPPSSDVAGPSDPRGVGSGWSGDQALDGSIHSLNVGNGNAYNRPGPGKLAFPSPNATTMDSRAYKSTTDPAQSMVVDLLRVPVTGLLEAYRGLAAEMIDAARTSKDQHISVLKLWLEDAAEWPARLEAAARSVLRMLGGVEEKDRRKHLTSRKSLRVRVTGTGGSRRARARTAAFSRCQQLFRNDPARLAQEVLDGSSPAVCPIPLTVVEEAYRRKWEVPGLFDGLGRFLIEGDADNGPFESALTATEVLESLRAMSSDSAPGPDGIKKQYLLEWDPECETVTRMFNVWMFTGVVPVCFKRCRTVLKF